MDQKFLSPLWQGRLIGMLFNVAANRGVKIDTTQNITLLTLLTEVMTVASERDQAIIRQLIATVKQRAYEEEQNGITISEESRKAIEARGIQEARLVYIQNGNFDRLVEEIDFYGIEQARLAEESKKRRRNRIITLSVAAVIVLGIIVYNLPFCKEYRAYKRAIEDAVWSNYYEEYPNGRYYEEVLYDEISNTELPVRLIASYLEKFPSGEHAIELEDRYNALWDAEIEKYKNRDKKGVAKDAVVYVEEMLNYMRDNRIHSVYLHNTSNILLKDYSEYDSDIKEFCNMAYKNSTLPFTAKNIISLRDNFSKGDQNALAEILSNGVESSFGKMFSKEFISVETVKGKAHSGSPKLTFEYTISNQEFGGGVPHIWTYTENNTPKAHLLGIDVSFKARYTIPGSETTFEFKDKGEPENDINGVENIQDGYRRMTQICFAKFSNKISTKMGLEETYFKGK